MSLAVLEVPDVYGNLWYGTCSGSLVRGYGQGNHHPFLSHMFLPGEKYCGATERGCSTRKWIAEILYGWPTYNSDRLCTVEKDIIWQSTADASALGLHSLLSVQSHSEQLSNRWERFSTFCIRLLTQLRWEKLCHSTYRDRWRLWKSATQALLKNSIGQGTSQALVNAAQGMGRVLFMKPSDSWWG